MPFKINADRRHRIPRQRHRVTNWPAYEAGLRARGSLTVWFTAEAVETWRAEPRTGRGGQPRYSSLAITTALTLRAVFAWRCARPRGWSTSGAVPRTLQLLGLDLAVPDHFHPEPPGRDAGGGTAEGGQRAGAPAGGQHRSAALWRGRVADREAWHQAALGLEDA